MFHEILPLNTIQTLAPNLKTTKKIQQRNVCNNHLTVKGECKMLISRRLMWMSTAVLSSEGKKSHI